LNQWRAELKLGDRWVKPNKGGYEFIFIRLDFSVNPPEGMIVQKVELELELRAEGSNKELCVYTISPKLEEEFYLQPTNSPNPSNNNLSISGKVGTLGSPQIEVGLTVPVNQPNSKVIGYIKKIGTRRFACWRFNSKPLEGFDYVTLIAGVPVDASTIHARLRTNAIVTSKHVFLRMLRGEPDKREIEYNFSLNAQG
jgi:hypothetical protein